MAPPKKIVKKNLHFEEVERIVQFLMDNDMSNYSLQIFSDGTASLRYGSKKTNTKSLRDMSLYLRNTFKE